MIQSKHLADWKLFSDSVLHIDPLTFLIGANSGGKSSFIEALVFLQRIASGGQGVGNEWLSGKQRHGVIALRKTRLYS